MVLCKYAAFSKGVEVTVIGYLTAATNCGAPGWLNTEYAVCELEKAQVVLGGVFLVIKSLGTQPQYKRSLKISLLDQSCLLLLQVCGSMSGRIMRS